MKIERTCKDCAVVFEGARRAKQCGACKEVAARRGAKSRYTSTEKKCLQCKGLFVSVSTPYCLACRTKQLAERRRARDKKKDRYLKTERNCNRCGAVFLAFAAAYCEKCRHVIKAQRKRERLGLRQGDAGGDSFRVFTKVDRACIECGIVYQGTASGRFCKPCRKRRETARRRGELQIETQPMECKVCARVFQGHLRRIYCDDCAKGEQLKKRARQERAKWAALREINPVVRQVYDRRPPACRECIYCEPRDEFESGMVCRAEAMLRCKPYAPGAQPLVRKEKV